jgi:hypothetical protein
VDWAQASRRFALSDDSPHQEWESEGGLVLG